MRNLRSFCNSALVCNSAAEVMCISPVILIHGTATGHLGHPHGHLVIFYGHLVILVILTPVIWSSGHPHGGHLVIRSSPGHPHAGHLVIWSSSRWSSGHQVITRSSSRKSSGHQVITVITSFGASGAPI